MLYIELLRYDLNRYAISYEILSLHVMQMQETNKESRLELAPNTFSNINRQFWTLQIAGWLGYAIVVFIAIVRPQLDDPGFNFSGQIINLLVETLSGFVLSYIQWLLIRRVVHLPLNITLALSFIFAAILILSATGCQSFTG